MHKISIYSLLTALVLGVMFTAAISHAAVAADDPFAYQSLTNLGPRTSSRVLLMNNDTNETCPIDGQGYHDSSNSVAVGQTYWWHDDTPVTDMATSTKSVNYYLNLLTGANHILYHKTADGDKPLWTLVQCRTGSAGQIDYTDKNGKNYSQTYFPWSSTCVPIDASATFPIPATWSEGENNLDGIKQVAHISMRCTTEACVYSPIYEDGIGEINFHVVNGWITRGNDRIIVEVAKSVKESSEGLVDGLAWEDYDWQPVDREVYIVKTGNEPQLDPLDSGSGSIRLYANEAFDKMYFWVKCKVNYPGFVRFRIRRVSSEYTAKLDYSGLILIDNILVSYPVPKANLSPTGVAADGVGKAQIGQVAAFTEPILSVGMTDVKPRMAFSADTNSLPPGIDWKVSVTNADFVWRWHYLDQAYGAWNTNKMSLAASGWLEGDTGITVTNVPGDIEYYYIADVAGSYYKPYDYAHDKDAQVELPGNSGGNTTKFQSGGSDGDNYWTRIREGVSPWEAMYVETEIFTNEANDVTGASCTNIWTMELTGDHSWRGFADTRTNYLGKIAHIRIRGKNRWLSGGTKPEEAEKYWYFPTVPQDENGDNKIEIPKNYTAVTEKPAAETDIKLDCGAGYLMFEFNDENGMFLLNRAEYQNFNEWTPPAGLAENTFIGNYVNTSYVGRAKQSFALDFGRWPFSRSTSTAWCENFDIMAGDKNYPFDVPFTNDSERTLNGWVAEKGMWINGFFSGTVDKTTHGMALQLEGRGNGSIALIDPVDKPNGIGTVSFSARLAQYLEFGDFMVYQDGAARENYILAAKTAMTHKRQDYYDGSSGKPSVSMVAYYRAGKGCYEARITRVDSTKQDDLFAGGKIEFALYKWYRAVTNGRPYIAYSLLTNRVMTIGSKYKNAANQEVTFKNYLVPAKAKDETHDDSTWSSMFLAVRNGTDSTYVEAGIAAEPSANRISGDLGAKMMSIAYTDSDDPHTCGTYGVGACECPAVFGRVETFSSGASLSTYCDNADSFKDINAQSEKTHIDNYEWGVMSATSFGRLESFSAYRTYDGGYDYGSKWDYGICAPALEQKLYLQVSEIGNASNWRNVGNEILLSSYAVTNLVFTPYITKPNNIRIKVGGTSADMRTDVVVDDIQVSQWRGENSESDLGEITSWAFTEGWIAGTTNNVYQGAGSGSDSDPAAFVTDCGYYVKKLNDLEFVYVFTNTSAGALGDYANFVPKMDMIVEELFILGGGGGGGPGGGGGGGGSALWITNAVTYNAGEEGLRIRVGNGGSGGSVRTSSNSVNPGNSGAGGNSYVYLKNPFTGAVTQYLGYGGGRGGTYRSSNDAGGNSQSSAAGGGGAARTSATKGKGNANYGSGFGGAAKECAPGGGGGGGLRGLGDNGANAAKSSARSVVYADAENNGVDGVAAAEAGKGGNGFPLEAMGNSEVRAAIGELLGDQNAWLGGGGGGGSGTNAVANVATLGVGAYIPGGGGNGGGGKGGLFTELKYSDNKAAGEEGKPNTGGGGGGGTFVSPVTSGNNNTRNWILGGGKGGNGIVVMRVRIKDRFVTLQPMRGDELQPMSVRTPFLNGISMFAFSWKWADSNAVLRVQVATNGLDDTSLKSRTTALPGPYPGANGWSDVCEPIDFSKFDDATRLSGSTNIAIGIRAPVSGVVRVVMDQSVIEKARAGAGDGLDMTYGMVSVSDAKVWDEPEIDALSWWGWNIMPSYLKHLSYLYDPVDLGPGRSCTLNFSALKPEQTEDYPLAMDPDLDPRTGYGTHDPFVQTPRFTNGVGQVSFKARVLETNLTKSAWVTVSGCINPGASDDVQQWTVLTNIEITADTTIFRPYSWRLFTDGTDYQALRLTVKGAKDGRDSANAVTNPIDRVIIDEVVVAQPMAPRVSFVNVRPFRHNQDKSEAIAQEKLMDSSEQPLLGETFGMQATLKPAGMEEELDFDSIRVYMRYYPGVNPWGWQSWQSHPEASGVIELEPASDWSPVNLVYRSNPNDAGAFIPPQLADDNGFKVLQYHVWAEFKNKNGDNCTPVNLSIGEWLKPEWYSPVDYNKSYGGNTDAKFSAYTILDVISPKRAWFNEINTYDGDPDDKTSQYIEMAVPQGYDMTGWKVECMPMGNSYTLKPMATLGMNGVAGMKTDNAVSSYAFIALESPATRARGLYRGQTDGVWNGDISEDGGINPRLPCALRLTRPNNIIEHEVVFMSTNTSTSRVSYQYDGTNYLKLVEERMPSRWFYAGADVDGSMLSLGVFTNHGESASCWTNGMKQTPGRLNEFVDGRTQYIDAKYFEPPGGTNLWIYAGIDEHSANSLSMVFGDVRNTSAVIIVPQNADGTFTTNIVYEVKNWFEIASVVTNELDMAGGTMPEAEGQRKNRGDYYVLDLKNIKLSNPDQRKFYVTASTRDSSKIADLGASGVSRDDPYYPAVVNWLQKFEESEIRLAQYWRWNDTYYTNLSLKAMYWLDIPPTDGDWVFKGEFGETGDGPTIAPVQGMDDDGMPVTNIRFAVKMMITNVTTTARIGARGHQLKGYARKVDRLLGLEPGSSSAEYGSGGWTSVTFKVTGALQNNLVNSQYMPLRWFVFGPDSWDDNFTAVFDILDPFSKQSPAYNYGWSAYPRSTPVFYGWSIDERIEAMTVHMLNSNSTFKVTSP